VSDHLDQQVAVAHNLGQIFYFAQVQSGFLGLIGFLDIGIIAEVDDAVVWSACPLSGLSTQLPVSNFLNLSFKNLAFEAGDCLVPKDSFYFASLIVCKDN